MTGTSTITDILQIAVSREIEANILYNMLAEYAQDEQIKKICLELASEELAHKAQLELEIMKAGKVVHQEDSAESRLNPLDYIFDANSVVQMDIKKLLEIGMHKEKQSFRFYIDMASLVKDEESREILLTLAEEEARHKLWFEIEYDRLIAKQDSGQ